jgi:hypothetical protein
MKPQTAVKLSVVKRLTAASHLAAQPPEAMGYTSCAA